MATATLALAITEIVPFMQISEPVRLPTKRPAKADMTPKYCFITTPIHHWERNTEQKLLNIKMTVDHAWKDLFEYSPTVNEETCIQGLVHKFLDENAHEDRILQSFRKATARLYHMIYFPRGVADDESVERNSGSGEHLYSGLVSRNKDRIAALEPLSPEHTATREEMVFEDPLPKSTAKSRGRKKVAIRRRPMPKTKTSAIHSGDGFVLKPILKPSFRGILHMITPDATEDETLAQLHSFTKKMRMQFMALIEQAFTSHTGIDVDVTERIFTIEQKFGEGRFSSSPLDRYFFTGPDDIVAGGSPILGVIEKCMTFDTMESQMKSIKIQVAGEMIACAYHRYTGFRYDKISGITLREQQPALPLEGSDESQSLFFLVFVHRGVHLVSAHISREYMWNLRVGGLRPDDQIEFKWSKRYPLYDDTSLAEAVRMILTLFFHLGHLWQSGKHFWRPFYGIQANLIY